MGVSVGSESVGTGRQKQLFFFPSTRNQTQEISWIFLVLFLRSGRPQDGPEGGNQIKTAERRR